MWPSVHRTICESVPWPDRKISGSCSRWHLHNFFLDSIGYELRLIVDVQLAHQVELVRFNRLDAETQDTGYLPERVFPAPAD